MPLTTIKIETGETVYKLPGSVGQFTMPPLPESETGSLPAVMFNMAAGELADFADAVPAILGDADLSESGRAKKLEPLQRSLVLTLAHVDAQLDRDVAHFDKREQDLLAIPKLEPSHAAMAVEDREIRDWLRSLSVGERAKMLDRLQTEPGHERLMIAVLRSPIPQLDHEVKLVRDVWKRLRRLEQPGEALAIDRGRMNVEWGRRGISQVAGLTRMALKWEDQRIVRTMLSSTDPDHHAGAKAFGINSMTVEVVKRAIAHESRQRQH